ncbi:LOG family protein [Ramlibacter sp. USB13]|uniref:AMP nucleosidase n=1 Tax=Ramlibacter cellulosilyticus TaxID=2764187 RepID=A0A923MUM5_9BURK|nr:LOG family protein [Ramlibacter cellulosilyticus]MBC5784949.1 LOG family protein [Ramlibacter cellulosilyticus]
MNQTIALRLPLLLATAALLSACAMPAGRMAADSCPVVASVPNGLYVAPYLGVENLLKPEDFARDFACSDAIQARSFPRGYVTIFGSSRIGENDDPIYAAVRSFAHQWGARYGRTVPVMTGAGPGLMDAANRGAAEAGAPSVGYTTYYDRTPTPTPQRPYGGDPTKALNAHVTHGLIFSSVAAREAAMIKHSAAMVFTPGGTGTEWEIYQVVEMIKSRQVLPVPVYFFGDRARYWKALDARLDDMVARRTVRRDELAFLKFVATPEELVQALRADLRMD